jgi:hypothetical protein
MKKAHFIFVAASMVIVTMLTTVVKSLAKDAPPLRVLDYTYRCVGSGGNCLPTVIIGPE